jgi:hypothetical protein
MDTFSCDSFETKHRMVHYIDEVAKHILRGADVRIRESDRIKIDAGAVIEAIGQRVMEVSDDQYGVRLAKDDNDWTLERVRSDEA